MADAKARAAARRQAILAGKSDRLAKLTTKAKSEGDPAGGVREAIDDPPLAELPQHQSPQSNDRRIHPQRTPQRKSSVGLGPMNLGQDEGSPFGFDPAQQEQLLRALMTSRSREGTPFSDPVSHPFLTPDPSNPFAPGMSTLQTERPKSLLEKLLPLVHVISTGIFLLFFLGWTNTMARQGFWNIGNGSIWDLAEQREYWSQWADLATEKPVFGWSKESQGILWAYLSLQVCLHAVRILTNSSPPQVPMLLSLVLPHLPPPLPLAIQTGMRYLQMFALLLDDFSVLVVGIGVIIFGAQWITSL